MSTFLVSSSWCELLLKGSDCFLLWTGTNNDCLRYLYTKFVSGALDKKDILLIDFWSSEGTSWAMALSSIFLKGVAVSSISFSSSPNEWQRTLTISVWCCISNGFFLAFENSSSDSIRDLHRQEAIIVFRVHSNWQSDFNDCVSVLIENQMIASLISLL